MLMRKLKSSRLARAWFHPVTALSLKEDIRFSRVRPAKGGNAIPTPVLVRLTTCQV